MGRKLAIASLICALVLGGWARARALRPDSRRQSALAALDSQNVERWQYELLYLADFSELQPYASLLKGALLLAAKQPAAALDQLEVAVARDETRVRGLVLSGEALYRLGRLMEAGEKWTRVVEIAPDDIGANRWLAAAYYDLGAADECFGYLREVARLAPGDPRPHRAMGLLHMRFGETVEALEAYQEALRLDPEQLRVTSIRLELAEALHRLARDGEALAVLEQCPISADVLALRAACVFGQGRVDQAWALVEQALSLDSDHLQALTLRGHLLLVRTEPKAAAQCLERAAQIAPRDLEVLNYLLAAHQRLGDNARVDEIKPIILETTRLRDAYLKLNEQAARDPRNAAVRAQLGLIAARLGHTDEGKSWFRASLYLEPGNQAVAAALQGMRGWDDPPEPMMQ